jgi:hypothetical protein
MSEREQPITPEIAAQIYSLHDQYPDLGHEGLGNLLEGAGVHVDEYELRMFVEEHGLAPGPTATWRPRDRRWFLWFG